METNIKEQLELVLNRISDLERKLERYYYILKVENELDFILKGTYCFESEIENIINGTY